MSLYGFLTETERRLFRDVQKVSGIGAKIALAVLSGVSVDDFARLVQPATCRAHPIPGIGKTAERMVVELRDRAADLGAGPVPAALPEIPCPKPRPPCRRWALKPRPKRMAESRSRWDDAAIIIPQSATVRAPLRPGFPEPCHVLLQASHAATARPRADRHGQPGGRRDRRGVRRHRHQPAAVRAQGGVRAALRLTPTTTPCSACCR